MSKIGNPVRVLRVQSALPTLPDRPAIHAHDAAPDTDAAQLQSRLAHPSRG